jgi:hypothetical protein
MSNNLWPDIVLEDTHTPVDILKEQAKELAKITKGILSGNVVTNPIEDRFHHVFYLVAPFLENYRYPLLEIVHKIPTYPLFLYDKNKEIKPLDGGRYVRKGGPFGEVNNAIRQISPKMEFIPGDVPQPDSEIFDKEQLIEKLKEIFSSSQTRDVINTLIAQSR